MVKNLRQNKKNKFLFKPVQNRDYNNQDGHNPDICKDHFCCGSFLAGLAAFCIFHRGPAPGIKKLEDSL